MYVFYYILKQKKTSKTVIVDNQTANLDILDTAGQEQFAALQDHCMLIFLFLFLFVCVCVCVCVGKRVVCKHFKNNEANKQPHTRNKKAEKNKPTKKKKI